MLCFLLILALPGCTTPRSSQANPASQGALARRAVPVNVATAVRKDVPVQLQEIGTVEAEATIQIKSLVEGQVAQVHFDDGAHVRKGQPLFTIDPRPFQAALAQAQANLLRDQVQAKRDYDAAVRYAKLVATGTVSADQYEEKRAQAQASEAAARADVAAVENAKLKLGYTAINSPINGRAGDILSKAGNLVKVNADTPMVTLMQTQPVDVSFSVPENYLNEIRASDAQSSLTVEAHIPGDAKPEIGKLTFINNEVNRQSGTIELKGTFENAKERLWPGRFVNVVLTLKVMRGVTVIPSQALQRGQEGDYVFVVRPDASAEYRSVDAEQLSAAETIVRKGVAPGEVVVTDGQLRLAPGVKVEIKEELSTATLLGGSEHPENQGSDGIRGSAMPVPGGASESMKTRSPGGAR